MFSPSKTCFWFPNALLDEFWLTLIRLTKGLRKVYHTLKIFSEFSTANASTSWQKTDETGKMHLHLAIGALVWEQPSCSIAATSSLLEMYSFVQEVLHCMHEAMKNSSILPSSFEENKSFSLQENYLGSTSSFIFIAGWRKCFQIFLHIVPGLHEIHLISHQAKIS